MERGGKGREPLAAAQLAARGTEAAAFAPAGLGLPSYCPGKEEEVLNAGRHSGNLSKTLWWRWRPGAPELLTLPVRAIGPFPVREPFMRNL